MPTNCACSAISAVTCAYLLPGVEWCDAVAKPCACVCHQDERDCLSRHTALADVQPFMDADECPICGPLADGECWCS